MISQKSEKITVMEDSDGVWKLQQYMQETKIHKVAYELSKNINF